MCWCKCADLGGRTASRASLFDGISKARKGKRDYKENKTLRGKCTCLSLRSRFCFILAGEVHRAAYIDCFWMLIVLAILARASVASNSFAEGDPNYLCTRSRIASSVSSGHVLLHH